jgi:hypothetical protein
MIMYWNNELTITMNTNTAATAAMTTAKEILANTSIEEYSKGEFKEFADALHVKKNEVYIVGEANVWHESYAPVLTEILKAIAAEGSEFYGNSYWDSTYDYARWEFSFNGKELSIVSTFHAVDEEPMCQECEEDAYYYNEETNCFVCPDCGHSISEEEYRAACETITIQKFNF